jgi:four helix bundle protein
MKNFRTYELAVMFYRDLKKLRIEAHLRDQLLRAAASVALNAAEGYGRRTTADRRRHFHIALGSLRESQAVLALAEVEDAKLLDLADHIGGCLWKLARAG